MYNQSNISSSLAISFNRSGVKYSPLSRTILAESKRL